MLTLRVISGNSCFAFVSFYFSFTIIQIYYSHIFLNSFNFKSILCFSEFVEVELLPAAPNDLTPLLRPLPSSSRSRRKLRNVLSGLLRTRHRGQRQNSLPINEGHFFGIGDSNDENIETAF